MKQSVKIAGLLSLVGFVFIQFFPPDRNKSNTKLASAINQVLEVPENVQQLLKQSCFDCHSNNTRYPWYTHIQPGGWYLAYHVKEGKAELNFDEFGSYSPRRQLSKLKSIANSVEHESMPLKSYMLLHGSARLSSEQRKLIINWALQTRDSLEVARN